MHFKMLKFILLSLIASTALCPLAFSSLAEKDNQGIYRALGKLALINHPSSIEPAFSKGSQGFSFGLGLPIARFENSELENWGDQKSTTLPDRFIEAYFVKGLSWPIDIGMSLAQSTNTNTKKLAGYINWTVYQDFRLPSLAIRYAYSTLNSFRETDMNSHGFQLLADFSFLRYFTIYSTMGIDIHQAKFKTRATNWALLEFDSITEAQQSWSESFSGVGFQLRPPYISIAFEWKEFSDGDQLLLAKLSFGI